MELEDCAFPLLADVRATDQADEAFEGADWVILVGGLPRKDGMSRADLIRANGPIFTGQGKAINDGRRPERPRPDRGQPVQHQLPDRPVARPEGPGRPLVRHDPARPEPRRGAAREEGGGAASARSRT